MKIEEAKRCFVDRFKCIHLAEAQDVHDIIKYFDGGSNGTGITNFLKKSACKFEETGASRGYFVIEKKSDNVVAYFSLKSGLLYNSYEESLRIGDLNFFETLMEAVQNEDEDLITEYKGSGILSDKDFADYLMKARAVVKSKSERSYNVFSTCPAIEIENLCKNMAIEYEYDLPLPLSFFIFWIFIVPVIFESSKIIGCEYIYLFAADEAINSDSGSKYKLVEHYKKYFKFHNMLEMSVVKPYYDLPCIEMVQSLKELKYNSVAIWEEFSE